MNHNITEKAWHIGLGILAGMLIGSFSTATAFALVQSAEYAQAQEGARGDSGSRRESQNRGPSENSGPSIPNDPSFKQGVGPSPFSPSDRQGVGPSPFGPPPDDGRRGPSLDEKQGQPPDDARDGSSFNMPDNGGPSEEDLQKEEERRAAQNAKNLERMKKSLARMKKEIASVKKKFEKHASKGVTVSAECTEAVSKSEGILAAVDAATTMDDMEDAGMEELREHFDTLNECNQTMERLAQIPKMLKRVDREIKNLERNWTRAKKGAPADAAEAIADGDAALRNIKNARTRLDEVAKQGDLDEFQAIIEDDVMGKFDDVNASIQRLDAAKNAKRFVSQFTSHIKKAEALIAKMKKLKKDTSDMEDVLTEMRTKYDAIKQLKPGTDDYEESASDLAELGQDFAAAAGTTEDVDAELQKGVGQNSILPKLTIPEGF